MGRWRRQFRGPDPGAGSGAGGFVETSGHALLTVAATGTVATAHAAGGAGTWLLDPLDITIAATAGGSGTIAASTITTALAMGNNVVVSTTAFPATVDTGTANGDITPSMRP